MQLPDLVGGRGQLYRLSIQLHSQQWSALFTTVDVLVSLLI